MEMATANEILYESYEKGKGLVLSITNSIFGKLGENEEGNIRYRQGSDIDISVISRCFSGSNVNVDLIERNNIKLYEIKREIKNVKQQLKNDKNYKFMIILMGSHGTSQDGRTFIYDTNNKLLDIEKEIFAPFYNHEFHEFAGRPKIFILNCCRGVMDPRFEPQHDGGIISSQTTLRQTETFKGDMCIVWATTDGAKALRYPTEGSPLIRTICNMIMDKAKNNSLSSTEFSRILQEAQRKVREDARTQIVVENTLRKSFFLSEEGTFF